MLLTDAVHIWREADGDYHIEWSASHPDTEVTVEALAHGTDIAAHYLESPPRRARFSGLPAASRHYFRLRDQHGNEVTATERKLGMEGTPNFRDFGGYPTADGRRVKWGFLFRSGQLAGLSDQDLQLLASLELDLVCDFRREEEQQSEPSRLPAKGAPRIASLPIVPGSNSRFFEEVETQVSGPEPMYDFMAEINREFAGGNAPTYARMFREILSEDNARFLVHCAAGKDRTGFAAAIILLALGVPREVVLQDYMLTGRYFRPETELQRLRSKYDLEHLDTEAIRPMLEVHEDYLERALAVIEQNYESLEHYLEEALGVGPVELEELRSRYLD